MARVGLLPTVVAVLAVVALAGCGGNRGANKIAVGYSFGSDVGDAGDRIAFQRAEKAAEIEVSYRDMGGTENAITGLVKGDIRFANLSYQLVAAAIGQGAPIKIILGANMAAEYLIVARPDISSIKDLRGKRIANSLPNGDTVVHAALEHAHMSLQDVKLTVLRDSPAKAAALVAGHVDAATLEYIDYERLHQEKPEFRIVARQVDVFPPYPATAWVVSSSWADDHRDLLQRIVDAMLDGYAFVYTPAGKRAWTDAANGIVGEGSVEPELLSKTYDYYRSIGFWPQRRAVFGPAQHDRVLRAYVAFGQVEKFVPYGKVWDASFWRHAAQS